jgi:hypothetical protein
MNKTHQFVFVISLFIERKNHFFSPAFIEFKWKRMINTFSPNYFSFLF